jgi:serine/threonine protein kinase
VLELELASGGDLLDFVFYPKERRFPEQVALYFFKQVISTLLSIRSYPCIQR